MLGLQVCRYMTYVDNSYFGARKYVGGPALCYLELQGKAESAPFCSLLAVFQGLILGHTDSRTRTSKVPKIMASSTLGSAQIQ